MTYFELGRSDKQRKRETGQAEDRKDWLENNIRDTEVGDRGKKE